LLVPDLLTGTHDSPSLGQSLGLSFLLNGHR
jgi:hypothetical protein